jgi:hypothetical protein
MILSVLLDLPMPAADSVPNWGTIGVIATVGIATAWLTWFLRNQLSAQRATFFRIVSKHNKEDDDAFETIRNDIRQIHLRNARVDGDHPPEMKPLPRRRYLVDDGGDENDG